MFETVSHPTQFRRLEYPHISPMSPHVPSHRPNKSWNPSVISIRVFHKFGKFDFCGNGEIAMRMATNHHNTTQSTTTHAMVCDARRRNAMKLIQTNPQNNIHHSQIHTPYLTVSVCPCITRMQLPVVMSHIRRVLSSDPEITWCPSGLIATHLTCSDNGVWWETWGWNQK